MRFLFCKSFICFCKSSSNIYSPSPLKLKNSHHAPSTAAVVSPSATDCSDQFCTETQLEVKDEDEQKQQQQPQIDSDEFVKSCLKKKTQLKETKKKVQWMDYDSSGKKGLVEIREFERSEYEVVMNNQGDGSHGCTIL